LTIEEQFYLLWPFIVFYVKKENVTHVCIFLIISSIIIRLVLVNRVDTTDPLIVLLPSQFDCLALSALLALHKNKISKYKFVDFLIKKSFLLGLIGLFIYVILLCCKYGGLYEGYSAFQKPDLYLDRIWGTLIFFFIGLISIALMQFVMKTEHLMGVTSYHILEESLTDFIFIIGPS
jgi:peptidoglycan/LPS O-acetylase OafA/YrhL